MTGNETELIWIPKNHYIKVNENIEGCAVIITSLDEIVACNDVLTSMNVLANKIIECTLIITR